MSLNWLSEMVAFFCLYLITYKNALYFIIICTNIYINIKYKLKCIKKHYLIQ